MRYRLQKEKDTHWWEVCWHACRLDPRREWVSLEAPHEFSLSSTPLSWVVLFWRPSLVRSFQSAPVINIPPTSTMTAAFLINSVPGPDFISFLLTSWPWGGRARSFVVLLHVHPHILPSHPYILPSIHCIQTKEGGIYYTLPQVHTHRGAAKGSLSNPVEFYSFNSINRNIFCREPLRRTS